jgi:hypothetical protein
MAKADSKAKAKAGSSAERTIERISEASFLVDEQEAKTADTIAFVHAVLCQIGLPRSPQKERVWTRTNGGASLIVQAGGTMKGGAWVEHPLPQGTYARLMLADISSYAVKHKTPLIPMEASVSAYMRRLRIFPGGGKRGTYTGFKREALALAAAHMEIASERDGRYEQTSAKPVRAFSAWNVDDGTQQALWPCELVLSTDYLESLQRHATPIDMRSYFALSHSAFAQDIYTWLVHRLPRLKKPLELSWAVLAEQFGGYSSVKEFRKDFLKRLGEVKHLYREARFEVVNGRRGEVGGSLRLKPSQPPVRRVAVVVPAGICAGDESDPRPADVESLAATFGPRNSR